jgi:hypothetical protein
MIPVVLASVLAVVVGVGAVAMIRPRQRTMTDYLELPAPDPSERGQPETTS